MSRGKYTPEFKARIVLEVLQGERELGAIAAENNLNPNMVRNWKAEFVENASSIFEEHGKAEREVKRKEAAAAKERDKMLKTIGQLTVERNFLQDCFRAVGKPVPETIQSLVHLKNNLIAQGRYTDGVDDVLCKVLSAKKRKFKIKYF